MNRLCFTVWVCAGVLFSAANLLASEPPRPERPNIIYILADDLGYGDLACQNPASKIPTPRLDALASRGMRFTNAHSPSSVCTPTRYGVLTGRYCWRSMLKKGVLGGYSPALIEPGRMTVPAMLKQHGYATACIGKWHLGMDWQLNDGSVAKDYKDEPNIDFTKPVKNGPTTRGFDYYYGISASLDMPPYVMIENDHVAAAPTGRQEKIASQYVRDGVKDPEFVFDQVLPRLTDKAARYIADRAGRNAGQPFFLYLPLNAPHTPIAPIAAFKGKSRAGDYGDYVVEVDWAVGRIIDALEQHKLAENTLLIVTSDNGPEVLAYPRIEEFHHYSMGDLRGVKRDLWEGGHRVPFIARWPGHIPDNSQCDETICHTDLIATAASIVGARLPEDSAEDSYNILPLLLGQKSDKPIREATVHHSGNGLFAIRRENWVYIDAPTGDDNRRGEPATLKAERGYAPHKHPAELYDLSADTGEHRNVFADHPDKVGELKALLEKYQKDGRSAPAQR